jgi:hypothetical protein
MYNLIGPNDDVGLRRVHWVLVRWMRKITKIHNDISLLKYVEINFNEVFVLFIQDIRYSITPYLLCDYGY